MDTAYGDGRIDERKEIQSELISRARSGKEKGYPVEMIAEMTGLSIEEITLL